MNKTQKGRPTVEKKKVDLSAVAADAGKNAMAFFGKAKDTIVKTVDQNGDGSLDLKDVSVIADTISNVQFVAHSNFTHSFLKNMYSLTA